MPRKSIIFATVFLLFAGLFSGFNAARADSIKERMLARLPQIDSLKERGVIGENNKGYLEFLGSAKPDSNVVAEENNDRRRVYEAIAAKQNTTVELVGRRRALQIAENAPSGTWLQAEDGSWFKKP
jgi:uncharacterized protein YdbL (DUF1318 family)